MAKHQSTSASPAEGRSIAYQAMDAAATFYLANGGPSLARAHVERLARELIFCHDCSSAYMDVLDRINAADEAARQEAERQAEERLRQQANVLLVSLQGGAAHDAAAAPAEPGEPSEPGELPAELRTERAMRLWQRLQDAGLIDEHYQPLRLSRTEAAVVAFELSWRLGIWKKWKVFETLWHRHNIRDDYNRAMDQKKTRDFLDKLKPLLAD